jgi:GAF domain-containing protein
MSGDHDFMHGLSRVVRDLTLARSLEDMADSVCRRARALVRAQAAVFVADDGFEHFCPDRRIGRLGQSLVLPCCREIVNWSMTCGKQAIVPDVSSDPRIRGEILSSSFIRSFVTTPVSTSFMTAVVGVFWNVARVPTANETRMLLQSSEEVAAAIGALREEERLGKLPDQSESAGHWTGAQSGAHRLHAARFLPSSMA